MSDDWGSLFRKGWETTNNPRATLDEMNYAVSCLAAALVTSPPHFPFVALMQLVRIHCSLADRDSAACSYHAETAVTLAQHALALSKENYPGGRAPKLQLLIKDALGSAHLRRYRSKGSKQDCLRAIGLHRACLMSESPDFPSRIVKASWHHHLSVALIEYVRDFWTTNLLPEMLAAFGAGYAALRLSRWSNPHYWTTLCGFRVFIMLETKHHSISWAERGRTTSDIIMSFLHDVVWVLHRRATELAHVWLDRASRQNPEPNIATAIKLIGLVLLLLSINKGDTDAFDKCARQVQHLLSEEQSEFDLRHSPYLLDLLGALVRCRRLGLHHEGLIGKIGVQLDTLLPGRAEAAGDNTEVEVDPPRHHPERPRLYYLRGEAIYYDISAQKMSGHRNLKYKYAIAHLRAALTMVPDGHPRQLQYLLSLAFALAGSSQSTGAANNEADEHLHEFYSWMQLIAALEMEEGHPQRDISRGDEFEKLVPLLFSLALDGQDVVVKFGLNYMGYRHGLATVHSEQHIETGIAFASLSVRQCLTDVKNIGYTKDTRRLVEQGLEIWKNLHRDYPGNSSITFGYGAALSVQADHEQFQGDDLNLAYDIYGEGIKLMHLSWETSNSSPLVDVENRLFLAETYLKRQGVYVVLTGGEMDESDIDQALRQLQISAARSESAGLPAAVTYSVAKTWTKHALDLNRNHRLVSKACSAHARALSQLSWVGLALDDRLKAMKDADQVLAARAAIWAIQEEQYELALELSEASHTVLFSSVASTLKAPKMIEASHPELWLQYTSLGKKIANTASFREESSKTDPGHLNKLDDAQELGDLGIEFDQCISKIRKIPGQENFLKPVSFSEHEAAAKNRLIASLITSQDYEYCYALLLLGKAPQAIRLSLRPSETETLVGQYKRALSHGSRRVHPNDDCGGYRQMDRYKDQHINPTAIATEVLKKLWYLVMKPIIDFIEKNVVKQTNNLLQLWLNATGDLASLPLHAAGVYDGFGRSIKGESVPDHIICSYAPSLSSLRPESGPATAALKALAIGSGESLAKVQSEVDEVYNILSRKAEVCKLVGEGLTKEATKALTGYQVIHIAAHASRDVGNPFRSGLYFEGGLELMMEELLKTWLPNAKLAVLFACETAQGDEKFAGEALHLAGAMLSIGFSGAIGTLWPMKDRDGVPVCKVFYETLLEGEGLGIDYSRAGLALHKAVSALRDSGVGVLRWAPFAHFGQ